ncbi:MAG: DJ-1/PfpI family protein [Mycobacterium sp.]
MSSRRREVSMVLFEGFEVLDVFGPIELFAMVPELFTVTVIGPESGPVRSAQGVEVVATQSYQSSVAGDIVMIPGGIGTRGLITDDAFLSWLREFAEAAELVTSVCTGSAVLAAAGLLNGYRATSNKRSFGWASTHGRDVTWVPQARWVADRDRWTSSGVAAGIDMTAALIRFLYGDDTADEAAAAIEYEIQRDPDHDVFAALNDLI